MIEEELDRIMSNLVKSCPAQLHKAIRYCTADEEGRHLASLCIAACELVGGDRHAALPMACTIEMWMAIILTTDDLPCMDNARTRKGRAAAHVEFDDTTAILAAQALAALAFGTVVDSTLVSTDKRLRLVKEFSLSMQRLVYGQYDDVKKGESLETLEELNAKNTNKTSSFFELPLVAGAIVGGAGEEEIEGLRRFGRYFGLMWQVNDDLSDATMTAEEMGKDASSDVKNRKTTYLTLVGAERSAQLRDELANRAREALLERFPAKNVKILLGIVEATRRFGSIYKNSQLLSKI
ncbi:geranylgeranyl pyrophosphate synthase 7, chloroplastic [Selaginella moellendorffii]|uniref:geranylgeranyl pyrophosphate synthase 7, chloroplastic n=1 Tax=Selaginella moellendorffii TaxID=88036 RepID=UPI000D1CD74C|nr:geranylgeranyl pyrophosphate synthase 7, chloroplastic [Selaginella moellendorffii]|eukprot:XP_002988768.2 geranylgeranyl pyrophosphate synthase 7, chloroplastic [Selaginella moellendorffii]